MADRAFKRVIEHRSVYVARSTIDGLNTETLEKTYLAITRGVPEPGIIDLPIEPDLENPLRVKMRLARAGRGLAAKTLIDQVEERVGYALVRCRLLTGRQHQIRLHLSSVGCPVVGDKLYGPDERLLARAADRLLDSEDLRLLELPRHALHAARYRLPHAVTGEALDLVSPLPEDLRSFWDELMRNPPNSPCRQPSANSSLALAPSKE
jgi:23S rRNA pseudouridine1911/1915/1917 synthase